MSKVNFIKNIAILIDFVISVVAGAMQKFIPAISGLLFGISAIVLLVAVVCVIIDMATCKK